eukprot:4804262-Amphidinium_carterae.3
MPWEKTEVEVRYETSDFQLTGPQPAGWISDRQYFTWSEAGYKVKWDCARALLADVAAKRPDFGGLETGLSTQTFRHLKRSANKTEDSTRSALNEDLGGVWHEVQTNSAFSVGELCVRCREEPEVLAHILFRCPQWHKERRQVELPDDDAETPPCVKLHGLLPAPRLPAILTKLTYESALVNRAGVVTVWIVGSGRHSSDPQHRRCGIGYYTDTQERVFLPLPGIKQSV